jgi:hypothetical protein
VQTSQQHFIGILGNFRPLGPVAKMRVKDKIKELNSVTLPQADAYGTTEDKAIEVTGRDGEEDSEMQEDKESEEKKQ